MQRQGVGQALVIAGLLVGACGGPPQGQRESQQPLPYTAPIHLEGIDTTVLRGRRILIDPGHGGRFNGTEGLEGTREGDVNLGVGLYLWGLLHDAGADVYLTRASDRDLLGAEGGALRDDLAARVHAIDSLAPDVFLSLHHNSNAALDRERDAIETYYKLDEDGPSYDLGRAIQARLAMALGIEPARLLPGNYYVLRSSKSPAVLGEASYLSNPQTEAQLRLANAQRLEATAYCLALVDYFSRGAAALEPTGMQGDSLRAGEPLRFTIAEPLDPLAIEVRLDDVPIETFVDAARGTITSTTDLPGGRHVVHARARLARGNAASPWTGTVTIVRLPARAIAHVEPEAVAPGGRARVVVAVLDSLGRGLGDGVPVHWESSGLTILDADDSTQSGEARVVVGDVRSGGRLQLQIGGLTESIALRVEARAAGLRWVQCTDSRASRPVPGAWAEQVSAPSDRRGWLALPASSDSCTITCRGYRPLFVDSSSTATLTLEPLYGGVLHAVRFAIDPAGAGGDPARPSTGVSDADANYATAAFCAEALHAGGAAVELLRDAAEPISDFERVRRATRWHPDWYLRLETTTTSRARVLHYPGSAGGERLARGLAAQLERLLGSPIAVATDTRFILQQTPCPALLVEWPAQKAADATAARRLAQALLVGIRIGLDPTAAGAPPLAGRLEPRPTTPSLVSLDGALVVPVEANGRFVFECVAPGQHRVECLDLPAAAIRVQVAGSDTTWVRLARP